MSSDFKFIWGDRNLLGKEKRVNVTDHSIAKLVSKSSHSQKKATNYANPHGFSYRTNRDKHQSVGKLYLGE